MKNKKIIPYINAENELQSNVIQRAVAYENNGADAIYLYNYYKEEKEREWFLETVREAVRQTDLPIYIGCYAERFEDIKKAFYTGASKVVIPYRTFPDEAIIKEAVGRFGLDKLIVEFDESAGQNDGYFKEGSFLPQKIKELSVGAVLIKHIELTEHVIQAAALSPLPIYIRDSLIRNDIGSLLRMDGVIGIATNYYKNKDIIKIKQVLLEAGIPVDLYQPDFDFSDFKCNDAGLIPVVVQDYGSNEVLMLAYMNREAFESTIKTGKMTYYSRSRSEQWIKGETSGHFQYVKSLQIDCDKDTLLAKVKQIGVACHTGNLSCFYTNLFDRTHGKRNSNQILNEVYETIMDRKQKPKEGSYTTYLFEKGIDKILKKCGEEAAEIIIAAKNPDAEELKYEIADYLYHIMVLMAEKGLDWEDIAAELANRH